MLASASRIKDPTTRLARIAEARTAHADVTDRLRSATASAIIAARNTGMTWAAIGDALGVSPQRAEQLTQVKAAS